MSAKFNRILNIYLTVCNLDRTPINRIALPRFFVLVRSNIMSEPQDRIDSTTVVTGGQPSLPSTCKEQKSALTSVAPCMTGGSKAITAFRNDNVLQYLDNPLWLVTVRDDLDNECRPNGMIVAHVAPAGLPSADCAYIMIECSNTNKTTQIIHRTRRFVLHLLSSYQYDLVAHFGLQSGHRVDKFAQVADPVPNEDKQNINTNINDTTQPTTTAEYATGIRRIMSAKKHLTTRKTTPTRTTTHTTSSSSSSVGSPPFTLANGIANDPATTTFLPVIHGTCGWLECEVVHTVTNVVPNGTIFIAAVKQQHTIMTDDDVTARRRALCSAVVTSGYDRNWILTKGLVYAQSTDIFQQHSRQLGIDTKLYQKSKL